VSKAQNATFLHHRNFMDYHSDRFSDASVMVFKANKLIAVLPANYNEDVVYSHQGLSYGGLIIQSGSKLEAVIGIVKSVLEYYHSKQFKALQIKVIPSIYNSQPSEFLAYLQHVLQAKLIRSEILSVIDHSNEDIKYAALRKRGLKKAQSQDLILKEVENLEPFYNQILKPNLQQSHQVNPVHSLEELQLLKQRFPNHIKQFNVYKDRDLVAGTTVFETKHVAHAQYIGSNQLRQELGSLDLLFHSLITGIYKEKSYFDFGNSNELSGLKVNKGLLYFKESFGARTITQQTLEFKTESHQKLASIFI
jgi:hypothetical protein